MLDEVVERGQRLGAGGGEPARPVLADEWRPPRPPSGRGRAGPRRRSRPRPASAGSGTPRVSWPLRRRLAVVGVEVPAAADGLRPLHQQAEPPARVAVEVLHQQPAPRAAGRPAWRSRPGWSRSRGPAAGRCRAPRHRPSTRCSAAQLVGWTTSSGPSTRGQRLAVGAGPDVGAPVAQLGGPVPHRREHQVRLLPVEPAAGEDAPGLDEQHLLAVVVQEVRPELVAEQPPSPGHVGSVGARGPARLRSVRPPRAPAREYGGRDLSCRGGWPVGLRNLLYGAYERRLAARLPAGSLPRHVGVMLDGNRRWARANGAGHRAGPPGRRRQDPAAARLVRGRRRRGGHPVAAVHRQPQPAGRRAGPAAVDHRGRSSPTSRPRAAGGSTRSARWTCCRRRPRTRLKDAADADPRGRGLIVNIAVGYGGRREIADAVRSLLQEHAAKGTSIEELAEVLDVEHIAEHLYTQGQPDPDLVIRTSGEQRLVGFLLWQSAHSEFYFCEALLARLPAGRLPAGPARLRRARAPLRRPERRCARVVRPAGGRLRTAGAPVRTATRREGTHGRAPAVVT